ncbi:MAG: DUF438 domain-containing protein [Peptococcaceae bacterium]|nr:DUF438 domain-containing protein [Peptococcaceae bacterium]
MSEYLQSGEYKQEVLKGLIRDLHGGRSFEEVKREFGELVKDVDASEIADMEQRLIEEGMDPEEIKKLCDVHAALFRETLSGRERPELIPDHPLHALKHENEEARKLLAGMESDIEKLFRAPGGEAPGPAGSLREKASLFSSRLDTHFSKKENIFFPYLERRNITGPPSVMWSVDDEIRDMTKDFANLVDRLAHEKAGGLLHEIKDCFTRLKDKSEEMFFKEEEILSPMMENVLTDQEWEEIKEQWDEFGSIHTGSGQDIRQPAGVSKDTASAAQGGRLLELDTGRLTPEQVNSVLTNLPVDITFVDENDRVAYFSQGRERIFTRTRAIIGRKVQNCHPPASVHVVEKILNDFKSGRHSTAQFWLELNGRFIHIRYVALRDGNGKYMGTMEVSQDLTDLRALQGERRLLQYSD